MLLAQHGADVIKVEPPEGDWSRRLGTDQKLGFVEKGVSWSSCVQHDLSWVWR